MHVMSVNKAGMDGVDREKISKIIAENTGASFSRFTAKQQERVDAKVAEIQKTLSNVSANEWIKSQKEADDIIAKLERSRSLSSDCVHIDMDAFFAAIEQRDDPRLRFVPMAVGSQAMLSTSNYIARRFGVRAAMPGFIAMKLCPELEIINGQYRKYGRESKIFAKVFAEYDDDFSMGSLDEAYIDISEFVKNRSSSKKFTRIRYGGDCICRLPLISPEDASNASEKFVESCLKCEKERIVYEDEVEFGTSRGEIVKEIRFRVEQATGLTCSAGIAANFMLAKICSDLNKPNGQYELQNDYEAIMTFLRDLPIRKVCGIGRVSEAHLKACQMETVGDILGKRANLKFAFTPLSQEHFLRVALGLPGRSREGDPRRKSISVERTFTPTKDEIELRGRCVTLKIKLSSFDVLTRSVTLSNYVSEYEDIHATATSILDKEIGQEMRLIGVRLSQLKFSEQEGQNGKTVFDYFKPTKRIKIDEDDLMDSESTSEGRDAYEESSLLPELALKNEDENEMKQEEKITLCPICNQPVPNDNNDQLNSHIDECLNLNGGLLREPERPRVIRPSPKINNKKKTPKGKNTNKEKKEDMPAITSFFQPRKN